MYFVRKECDDNGKLISISVENVFKLEKKNVEHFIKNIFPKVANNKEEHVKEKTMFYNHVKKTFFVILAKMLYCKQITKKWWWMTLLLMCCVRPLDGSNCNVARIPRRAGQG